MLLFNTLGVQGLAYCKVELQYSRSFSSPIFYEIKCFVYLKIPDMDFTAQGCDMILM